MSFLTPLPDGNFSPGKNRNYKVEVELKKFSLQPQIIKFATADYSRRFKKI